MIVAAIAYHELSADEQATAVSILQNHPNAKKWHAEVPEGNAALDEGIVALMGAAKWPDEIKFGSSTWNHKLWHYVDYPVTPPSLIFGPSPDPSNDIVFAINQCVAKLKDAKESAEAKACWLSWLIHIVGDINQPLHCCALVNADFPAPDGDRGGNLIFVRAGTGKGVPLHKMWDDATGNSRGFHAKLMQGYSNQATALRKRFPRIALPELATNNTPVAWARESWEVAVEHVYLNGALRYGKDANSAPMLPDGYTKNLKAIAQRRIASAGYRLADAMREALQAPRQR